MRSHSVSAHRHPTDIHSLRFRHHVVAPVLRVPDVAGGAAFAAARLHGPVARDVIAQVTSLSIATVNRQVSGLLNAGILRERPDLVAAGAIGRPRVPVEVNHERFVTLGVHIGARITNIVAADLLGRSLDAVEVQTPTGPQEKALASLAGTVKSYLGRWRRRRPLWAGVTIGGIVDSTTGFVNHPRLGWSAAPVGPAFARALGLRVSVAAHVEAMAAAELLLGGRRATTPATTTLYVYARETVGYALVIDGRVHSPANGPGTIAGLPASSELLGGSGQLESTVSDEAVLTAARRMGIVHSDAAGAAMEELLQAARRGESPAHQLLTERARVLGEAVALLRDVLNPDDLVVGGQAFTDYGEGLAAMQTAFSRRSVLPPRDIRMTRFGNRVQEAGAAVVSLSPLYADPMGTMRRAEGATAGAYDGPVAATTA